MFRLVSLYRTLILAVSVLYLRYLTHI